MNALFCPDCGAAPCAAPEMRELPVTVLYDTGEALCAAADICLVLRRRMESKMSFERQDWSFSEIVPPATAKAAAEESSAAALVIIAIAGDRELPLHVRAWLERWLSTRDRERPAALVSLMADRAGADAALAPGYLAHLAEENRLAFFDSRFPSRPPPARETRPVRMEAICPPPPRWGLNE